MLVSFLMLVAFLVLFCSPGLIAMSIEDRRAKQNEAA